METIRLYFDRAAVVSEQEKWTNYPADSIFDRSSPDIPPPYPELVCGLSTYPDNIKFKEISKAELGVYLYQFNEIWHDITAFSLEAPFDENTVTKASMIGENILCIIHMDLSQKNTWGISDIRVDDTFRNAVRYGIWMDPIAKIATPKGTNKPFIALTYGPDDIGLNVTPTYPTGEATISKAIATTFTWDAAPTTDKTLELVEAASAVLRWKYSGASSYTEVVCDNPTQHTIPANTFSTGTLQWQVVVTANSGVVTEFDWVTTQVEEPTPIAAVLYPVNSVIDGAVAQTFAWEHIISNGTPQHAFDLQTSPDGSVWTTIQSAVTAQTKTELAPGTLAAGDLWWRVRTYGLSGTVSNWSDAAHCIVVAAPAAPSITAVDNSPKFILRWQQSGQQAYELMVDGVVIAKTFSAESIYRHDGYLEPGSHKVQVRIQNQYQMWSEWGTATLQIENTEGAAIQLSASGENEVLLNWSTGEDYDKYIIYRNGLKIAETASSSFVDHFAVGESAYRVRGVYENVGNYTMSNEATITVIPKAMMIAAVFEPVWIELPLSTSSLRSAGMSASQSVTYTHYVGTALPAAEIGEAVSKSYNLDCAFKATDLESIRLFEALLGKVVCIKTPSQRRIIGVMSQMNARENRFYVAYSVPITEVRWEEMQT